MKPSLGGRDSNGVVGGGVPRSNSNPDLAHLYDTEYRSQSVSGSVQVVNSPRQAQQNHYQMQMSNSKGNHKNMTQMMKTSITRLIVEKYRPVVAQDENNMIITS